MARALELAWPDVDLSGVVVTRYGHAVPTERITAREASHPMPDKAGHRAAAEILQTVQQAGPDDLVLALIPGGGSALMTLAGATADAGRKEGGEPAAAGIGADHIEDMNRIRRRLSLVKGAVWPGAAAPARDW